MIFIAILHISVETARLSLLFFHSVQQLVGFLSFFDTKAVLKETFFFFSTLVCLRR